MSSGEEDTVSEEDTTRGRLPVDASGRASAPAPSSSEEVLAPVYRRTISFMHARQI